ncbi:MAG: helix-turn-helix transcriptional regulator [Lachnospiraceae bacterium]|nr:helix-turn-helix transcriptional regulator [Lachnospiraceae bacterium]
MELCNQMKKYRTEAGLSQDALAEKIFVSRQTISNWETGKNYPDINSLLRMSEVFGVSVDALLKGDVEEIKEMINKEDQREFDRIGRIYSVLMLLMIITPIPLAKLFKFWGLGIWACLAVVTLLLAATVEKKKKELNIQTYREIIAFMEGKRLDELEAVKEEAKRPYQKTLIVIAYAAIALIVNLLMLFLWK